MGCGSTDRAVVRWPDGVERGPIGGAERSGARAGAIHSCSPEAEGVHDPAIKRPLVHRPGLVGRCGRARPCVVLHGEAPARCGSTDSIAIGQRQRRPVMRQPNTRQTTHRVSGSEFHRLGMTVAWIMNGRCRGRTQEAIGQTDKGCSDEPGGWFGRTGPESACDVLWAATGGSPFRLGCPRSTR